MFLGSMWRGNSNACNLSLYRVWLSGREQRGHDGSLLPDSDLLCVPPRCWITGLSCAPTSRTFCVLGTHMCVASRFSVIGLGQKSSRRRPLLLPLRTEIGAGEKGGILRPELPDHGTHISKTRAALQIPHFPLQADIPSTACTFMGGLKKNLHVNIVIILLQGCTQGLVSLPFFPSR